MLKLFAVKKSDPKPIRSNNVLVYTEEETAEVLANNIQQQCSVRQAENSQKIEEVVSNSLNILEFRAELEIKPKPAILQEIIISVIKNLKVCKAPGHDDITNKALKLLPRKLHVRLLNIINACLLYYYIIYYSYFLQTWKTAIIVTILKPGKHPTQAENDRPISLLPHLSKILERVIQHRLKEELDEKNILPDEQFGIRSTLSAEQQALRLTEKIANGITRRDSTGVLFLDISKAFDRVWHFCIE